MNLVLKIIFIIIYFNSYSSATESSDGKNLQYCEFNLSFYEIIIDPKKFKKKCSTLKNIDDKLYDKIFVKTQHRQGKNYIKHEDLENLISNKKKEKQKKTNKIANQKINTNFRKFNDLINYKIDKKQIIMSDVEAITIPSKKPVYYKSSTGKKYASNEDSLNKNLYRFFIQNSTKHNLLNPGDIFTGIINLEILYSVKLYKKRKSIQRYIDNTKSGKKWLNMLNDKKTIISLIQMKESIDSVREELGITKEQSTQEAIKSYEIMTEFLNKDEYKITRKDWLEYTEEQKKLMEKYIKYLNEINKTLEHAEKNI